MLFEFILGSLMLFFQRQRQREMDLRIRGANRSIERATDLEVDFDEGLAGRLVVAVAVGVGGGGGGGARSSPMTLVPRSVSRERSMRSGPWIL